MTRPSRLLIALDGAERTALAVLAEQERRELRAQASHVIHTELQRLGLLPAGACTATCATHAYGEPEEPGAPSQDVSKRRSSDGR